MIWDGMGQLVHRHSNASGVGVYVVTTVDISRKESLYHNLSNHTLRGPLESASPSSFGSTISLVYHGLGMNPSRNCGHWSHKRSFLS